MNMIGWILMALISLDVLLMALLGIVCLWCKWRDRHEKR